MCFLISKVKIDMQQKKVLILGEEGSGKTTFMTRLRTGNFVSDHIPTLGAEVSQVRHNNLILKMWDLAGNKNFCGEREAYFTGANCCLIFVDLSKESTPTRYRDMVQSYMQEVRSVCGDIPFILIGNKCDLRLSQGKDIELYNATSDLGFARYETVSGKSNYGMEYVLNNITRYN